VTFYTAVTDHFTRGDGPVQTQTPAVEAVRVGQFMKWSSFLFQ